MSSTKPDRLRSSGTKYKPSAMASRGARTATSRPSSRIVPPSAGSIPKAARASEVRPDPTNPARPRISPGRACKLAARSGKAGVTRSRSSNPPSGRGGAAGGTWSDCRSRPIISRVMAAWAMRSRGNSPATVPSRRQSTRSAAATISPSRCVM